MRYQPPLDLVTSLPAPTTAPRRFSAGHLVRLTGSGRLVPARWLAVGDSLTGVARTGPSGRRLAPVTVTGVAAGVGAAGVYDPHLSGGELFVGGVAVTKWTDALPLPVAAAATAVARGVAAAGGRAAEPAAMFSEDERYLALGLLQEGYSCQDVADIIKCSVRSLQRWRQHWDATGSVWCNPTLRNTHRDNAIYNGDIAHAILSLVQAEPAAFLKQHGDLLKELKFANPDLGDLPTSRSTVYRILRFHGYTRKKIERLFSERVIAAQVAFVHIIIEIPMRCIVSIDETHKAGGDCYRLYGRSLRNVPCVLFDQDPRTIPRTSTMMAVSMAGGVLWSQTVKLPPAQTSDDWRIFLQGLHPHLGQRVIGQPWHLQPDSCVLLFDNAAIHDAAADEFLQNNGIHFLRLPPYSPNFQPIEGVFNELKRHIRDLVYSNGGYLDKPLRLIALATSMLTHAQIYGQFVRVSDNFSSALEMH